MSARRSETDEEGMEWVRRQTAATEGAAERLGGGPNAGGSAEYGSWNRADNRLVRNRLQESRRAAEKYLRPSCLQQRTLI